MSPLPPILSLIPLLLLLAAPLGLLAEEGDVAFPLRVTIRQSKTEQCYLRKLILLLLMNPQQ